MDTRTETYHWCNEHPEHVTGPGVTTKRGRDRLRQSIIGVGPDFVSKLIALTEAGIIPKWEAKQLLDRGEDLPR